MRLVGHSAKNGTSVSFHVEEQASRNLVSQHISNKS